MGRRLALGSGLEVPVTLAHGVSSGPHPRSRRANSKKKLPAYCCRIPYIYAHSYDYYNSLYTRADNWSVFIVVFNSRFSAQLWDAGLWGTSSFSPEK